MGAEDDPAVEERTVRMRLQETRAETKQASTSEGALAEPATNVDALERAITALEKKRGQVQFLK